MFSPHKTRSSGTFLLEFIFVILFFSIASVICIQLFVKAHLLSRKAEYLAHGVNECSNMAEIILSEESSESIVALLFDVYSDAALDNDSNIVIPFDDTHHTVIHYTEDPPVFSADISFIDTSAEEVVYELTLYHRLQEE